MKALKIVGAVVAVVALTATTLGMAFPAIAGVTAGGVGGMSAATLMAIGTWGGIAAGAVVPAVTLTKPKGAVP